MASLAQALMVAIRVHAGQTDKQGEPYLLHMLRVVEAVKPEAKVVAALHDVLEDGMCLAALVGFVHLSVSEEAALDALTHREDWTYSQYIDRLRERSVPGALASVAREVKLADLRDNLGRIPARETTKACGAGCYCEWEHKWGSLQERYEKAIATLRH